MNAPEVYRKSLKKAAAALWQDINTLFQGELQASPEGGGGLISTDNLEMFALIPEERSMVYLDSSLQTQPTTVSIHVRGFPAAR